MSEVMQGPYANADHAPLVIQKCLCPLNCPVHGENGSIPGGARSAEGQVEVNLAAPRTEQIELEGDVQTPQLIESYRTPPAIIPIEIANAGEILRDAGVSVEIDGEDIVVKDDQHSISFSFEVANALCQEILKIKKRIELTLPETLEITLEAMRQRLGHDMAPLADLFAEVLKQRDQK